MANPLYDALIAPHLENDACFLETTDAGGNICTLTFSAFCQQSAQMAHVLVAKGLKPGDRILVQSPKTVEMLALYAAALQTGVIFLPLNTAYTFDEIHYFITDAAPGAIVCSDERAGALTDIITDKTHVLTLNADGSGSLKQSAETFPATFPAADRGSDDLAALLYTSGTTGRSKGAMLSQNNLLSNARVLVDEWRITCQDRLIHALPIFHTHGLFVAINTALLAGARIRFMPVFDLDAVFSALPRSTLMMGVPTFYTRLLNDARLKRDCTSNMRLFISGSAPLLAETHNAFAARTGHRILERYGMTETNMTTSNPYEGDRRAGTVGHALPGVEVRLTDPTTGNTARAGDIGMIEVRGSNVFKGYWNMPEKTAEEMRPDGFFITGDLGQFDPDGYLSIVGRQKDLIITGGYNVYPKEIEDVLNQVSGVRETAVFGVPDADFGEKIIAAFVPDAGQAVAEDTLRDAVAGKLARFKHPRLYRSMRELPRNTMGKIQKNVLRAGFAD